MITVLKWFYAINLIVMIVGIITYRIKVKVPVLYFNEFVCLVLAGWLVYLFWYISEPWLWFWITVLLSIMYSITILILMVFGKVPIDILVPWYLREEKEVKN